MPVLASHSGSSLPSCPSQCVWRVVPSGCIYLFLLVRHSTRFVRSRGSVCLPFAPAPRVSLVCARSCSGGVQAPHTPPRVGVAR